MYYVKDTKDSNLLVVVKTMSQNWYDMLEETINEACQENKEINSISFISNVSGKE